jgi:hypothetical protein
MTKLSSASLARLPGRVRSACAVVFALLGLAVTAGCDTSIQPFADETGLYSVYGYLAVAERQHTVRVRKLNDPVADDANSMLDATVTLENLTTGTTETLADSVVTFDGTDTHNFQVRQPIQPENTYRLTVRRSDGRVAQATATTPPVTDVDIELQNAPVGCGENDAIILYFRNVPRGELLRLAIGVRWDGAVRWVERDIDVSYGFKTRDAVREAIPRSVWRSANGSACSLLDDPIMRLAYTHLGPDWPSDSLGADPLTSNVENGLGRFGGLHRDTLTQVLNTTPR